jgi:hypothetical protein
MDPFDHPHYMWLDVSVYSTVFLGHPVDWIVATHLGMLYCYYI